jgi:GLPGLI family protein
MNSMNKMFTIAFTGLLILAGLSSRAQKSFSEGSIVYNVTIQTGSASNTATNTVYIKGNNSRTEMISTLGNEITIYNSKTGNSVILKEFSGQKLMIRLTKENWDSKNSQYRNINFNTTGETKVISGYNCKKATAKLEDGKTLTVYYTTDVTVQNKQYDATFTNLPGLPLEYEIETGKLKFNYTVSKISFDAVPVAKFDFPTTGYRVMTYEENQQMKKGN